MDLVSDNNLQMALGSDLLIKFEGSLGEECYITLTNAICCTSRQVAAMPLSTKRIMGKSASLGGFKAAALLAWLMHFTQAEMKGKVGSSLTGSYSQIT